MIKDIFKKLPRVAQTLWKNTFELAKAKFDESKSERIAWTNIKNKFTRVEDVWVARTSDFSGFKTIKYVFDADTVLTGRSEGGYTYIDYVLSSNAKDGHGTKLGIMALNSFVDRINEKELVGRIEPTHRLLDSLKRRGMTSEEIEEYLNNLDTGITAIKAIRTPDNKVIMTTRVKDELVEEAKVLKPSAEFSYPAFYEGYEEIPTAELRSFILTPNPSNPDAVIVGEVNGQNINI